VMASSRVALALLVGSLSSSWSHGGSAQTQEAEASWQVLAVQYARSGDVPSVRWGGSPEGPEVRPMSWHFLVLRRGNQVVLIDCGTDRFQSSSSARERWNVIWHRGVVEALRAAGIAPESVTDIILTHHHWDHAGGLHHFLNARTHLDRAEWARLPRATRRRLLDTGGVRFVRDGGSVDGVRMMRSGAHTRGSLMVEAACREGQILVVGDAVYFPEQLGELPRGAALSERVAAGPLRAVITGHDSALFRVYPQLAEGVALLCEGSG